MSGPTHGSAPTNSIETSLNPGRSGRGQPGRGWACPAPHPLNPGRSGRGQSPAPTGLSWCAAAGRRTEGMASADQILFRNLVGGHRHRPLRGEGKAPSATLASGAEHLRQRSQGVGGTCGRDHPQSVQQPRAIPQSRHSRDSSLCTREPLACGGRESGRTHRSAPTRSSECPATPGGAGQSPPPTERRGIRRGLGR